MKISPLLWLHNKPHLSDQKTIHWCLIYSKKNITWSLGDMTFLFSCWKNNSFVRCAHSWNIFQHLKRNFVPPRGHVISSTSTAKIALKKYLLPPSKQFETTTNQEILKAFVMSQGVLFSCVKSHRRFSNFLLQSLHFFLNKVSSSSHGSPVFCHPYLKLKQVDMKKSLAMKGYVPFVTATKLKMKIISY